jgi:hypothetical protein
MTEEEIIRADERKKIYHRWMEIHEKGNWVREYAAYLTLNELARQENLPPYHNK